MQAERMAGCTLLCGWQWALGRKQASFIGSRMGTIWQREEHLEKLAKILEQRVWTDAQSLKQNGTLWGGEELVELVFDLTGHVERVWMFRRSLWWVQRAREDCHCVAGSRSLWGRQGVNMGRSAQDNTEGKCAGKESRQGGAYSGSVQENWGYSLST